MRRSGVPPRGRIWPASFSRPASPTTTARCGSAASAARTISGPTPAGAPIVIAIVLLAIRLHPQELKGGVEQQARLTKATGLGGERNVVAPGLAPDHARHHLRPGPDRG